MIICHRQVTSSPIESFDTDYMFLRGFGYDPSTDDYLVIQAYCDDNDDDTVRAEIFSLRANAWKEIETNILSYTNTDKFF